MATNSKQIHTSYDEIIYVTDSKTGEIIRVYTIDQAGNQILLWG